MKIIGTFGVVVIASIALLQTAEARPRGGGGRSFGGGFSSGHSFSSGSRSYAPRSFSSSFPYRSGPRYSSQPSSRYRGYSPANSARRSSSQAALRNRSGQRRIAAVHKADANGRVRSDSNAVAPTRTAAVAQKARFDSNTRALRAQGLIDNGGRVDARQTRNWNRNGDHNWNGNRCRWRNNCWVVIGPWYPWWGYGLGYGYYPYASYYGSGYYDDRYYDDGYGQYDEGNVEYNVSDLQSALARAGYYDGAIDGSFGPATRSALRRFQRDRGLSVTGQIDRSVIDALRVR